MSKHKSEVLTVKIQSKVKLPHAVIIKIRTLPPVFQKIFRTAVWRKARVGCFWHYVRKTINLCSRKVALTVFTECALLCFLDRENIVPGHFCIMKANVRYRQKAIFSFKKYLPTQSMISSCSKSSKSAWWSGLF